MYVGCTKEKRTVHIYFIRSGRQGNYKIILKSFILTLYKQFNMRSYFYSLYFTFQLDSVPSMNRTIDPKLLLIQKKVCNTHVDKPLKRMKYNKRR